MADYIGATPIQNPLMGLLAERLKQAQEFAVKPFGYSNPPAEAILNLLGIPAVQQTAERIAYGEPLTTGRGMTAQIRPEVVEAAMTVAPAAGLLGNVAERGAMAVGRAGERYAEKVVPQIMERGGLPAQLLGDLSQGSIRPMDVWHGSPHGPFTKFDPTKIGSGEGAQAFSYGHYLGEARGTGETYRNQLVRAEKEQINKLLQSDDMASQIAGNTLNEYKNPSSAIGALKSSLTPSTTDIARAETNKAIKMLEDVNKDVGYIYKVDLPDEAIANMLDWDKPVSKQPNVMKALRSEAEQRVRANKLADIENDIRSSLPAQDIGDDYLSMFSDANVGKNQEIQSQALEKLNKMDLNPLIDKELDSMKPVDMNWNMTGKEFYELLSSREGSPEKASGLLQRQGVPGTRYLDQQSRTPGGSDTSNFVVYPGGEDLLTIKEINDKPVGGLLGQSKAVRESFVPGVEAGKEMIVHHNISPEKLARVERLGGMPVPSLAVSNVDNPMTNFGDISLIGSKEMAIPSAKNPVYGFDAYTARAPQIDYSFDTKSKKALEKSLSDVASLIPDGSSKVDRLINRWEDRKYSDVLMAKFLKDEGYGLPEIDAKEPWKFSSALNESVSNLRGEYSDWLNKFENSLPDKGVDIKERIFKGYTYSGNRRYAPATLENIVKEMKGGAGEEGFFYGVPNIRAVATPRFKTLNQVKAARENIVTQEEFEPIKKQVQDAFDDITGRLGKLEGTAGYSYEPQNALYEIGQTRNVNLLDKLYKDVPQELKADVQVFMNKVREMPTEYFEIKPQRAVQVGEFKGAIVPENAPKGSVEYLRNQGIQDLYFYATPEERKELFKKFGPEMFGTLPLGLLGDEEIRNQLNLLD